MAKAAWTKRDKTSGEFMVAVMKSAKKFKGMGREKAFKSDGLGAGASGTVFVSVSRLFDGVVRELLDGPWCGCDRFSDATERAVVLTAVKDAARR
jgi:hypothetical protein